MPCIHREPLPVQVRDLCGHPAHDHTIGHCLDHEPQSTRSRLSEGQGAFAHVAGGWAVVSSSSSLSVSDCSSSVTTGSSSSSFSSRVSAKLEISLQNACSGWNDGADWIKAMLDRPLSGMDLTIGNHPRICQLHRSTWCSMHRVLLLSLVPSAVGIISDTGRIH